MRFKLRQYKKQGGWETRYGTQKHTIFQSGKSNGKREFGIEFIVNKEMKKNIPGFTPVSERICRLRVKTRFLNLSVINVHAPTEDKDETEKDELKEAMVVLPPMTLK
jgi:hypothetical protein